LDKKTKPVSITELLKADGKKIGIVSSVTINHATPAAFYAHIASARFYEIALQMAAGDFDYYGGGTISQATGKKKGQAEPVRRAQDVQLHRSGYQGSHTRAQQQLPKGIRGQSRYARLRRAPLRDR
jgi:alkaline phosphatase